MKLSNNLIGVIVLSIIALIAYTVVFQEQSVENMRLDKDGFNIKFKGLKEVPNDELESRQAKLEAELDALKGKYQAEKQSPVTSKPPQQNITQYNLNGRWQSQQGDFYDISQYGNAITVQEINPIYGVTAIGQGTLYQNTISVNYHTALNTYGSGQLQIVDNGNRIEGTFIDTATGTETHARLFR